MGADQNFDWQAHAASALEWWRDAGVDTLVDETPRDWTAVPAPSPVPPRQRAVAELPVETPLPLTLDAFLAWRVGAEAPEAGWPGTPIAAAGDPVAEIMVIVDVPDRDDAATGALLSGAAGKLFDRMLAAIGLDRARIALVPMCTRRPPAGRITPEIEARLVAVTRRHVLLARPRRVFVLGNAPSRALTGADVAPARGSLHAINLGEGTTAFTTEAVASFHPRFLIERPAAKAEAWKDLQMLTTGLNR